MNWFKKMYLKATGNLPISDVIHSITCVKTDKKNICDVYINGKETNIQLGVFDKDDVEKLQKIRRNIQKL